MECKSATDTTKLQSAWAEAIPEEILLGIFKLCVGKYDAVPFLCRVAQVCRYWKEIAYHWELWQHVDLSSGWINKSPSGLSELCESRFGDDTVSLKLEAWFQLTDKELVTVAHSCRMLKELDLSSCHKLPGTALGVLADEFEHLTSLTLANMAPVTLGYKTLNYFIQKKGPRLETLILSNVDVNKNFQKNMQNIMLHCPQLLQLELTHFNFLDGEKLTLYVSNLQFGCPKLQVLNLSGTRSRFYNPHEDEIKCPGFPNLREYHAPIDDVAEGGLSLGSTLILKHSFNLKTLVLERNKHDLDLFPPTDVEHLKLPEDCKESEMLSQIRWKSSLKVLDLSWMKNISRTRMDAGLKRCFSENSPAFVKLNQVYLCGTQVSWHGLCFVVKNCKTLTLLNCTLCPNVPKFWARELSRELLTLLYKLVTEELSQEELKDIQAGLQEGNTA